LNHEIRVPAGEKKARAYGFWEKEANSFYTTTAERSTNKGGGKEEKREVPLKRRRPRKGGAREPSWFRGDEKTPGKMKVIGRTWKKK